MHCVAKSMRTPDRIYMNTVKNTTQYHEIDLGCVKDYIEKLLYFI